MRKYDFSDFRVLVVDDNRHMRFIVREHLFAFGFRGVLEASDGGEALELLKEAPADIVISDWMMQPVDGITLTQTIRMSRDSANPCIPIVLFTGMTYEEKIAEARDAGVTEILAKPMSIEGLLSRLTRIVDHPRDFVRTRTYFGPDRRRRSDPFYRGPMRRAGDAERPTGAPPPRPTLGVRNRPH